MRPATHDDPNAIPRNGTEVPWVDLRDPGADQGRELRRPRRDSYAGSGDRQRRG